MNYDPSHRFTINMLWSRLSIPPCKNRNLISVVPFVDPVSRTYILFILFSCSNFRVLLSCHHLDSEDSWSLIIDFGSLCGSQPTQHPLPSPNYEFRIILQWLRLRQSLEPPSVFITYVKSTHPVVVRGHLWSQFSIESTELFYIGLYSPLSFCSYLGHSPGLHRLTYLVILHPWSPTPFTLLRISSVVISVLFQRPQFHPFGFNLDRPRRRLSYS